MSPATHSEYRIPISTSAQSSPGQTGAHTPANVLDSLASLNTSDSHGDLLRAQKEQEEARDVLLELGTGFIRGRHPTTGHATRQPSFRSVIAARKKSKERGRPSNVGPQGSPTRVQRLWGRFITYVPHITLDDAERCTKAVLAYSICALMILIDPVAAKIGPNAHLTPFAVLYFPPVQSVGQSLETTLIGTVGILFGALVALIAQSCSVAYNRSRPITEEEPHGSSFILLTFLALGVFIIGFIRAAFPRLQTATATACTILVFPVTGNIYERKHVVSTIWNVTVPFFLGAVVSFIVAIAVRPKFSGQVLRKSIQSTAKEARELLDLLVTSFLLESPTGKIPLEDIIEKQVKLRDALSQTKAARRQCRYEITFDRYSPHDYKSVIQPLQTMMKYLSGMVACLKIEKELMEKEEPHVDEQTGPSVLHTLHERLRQQEAEQAQADANNLTVKSLNNLTVSSVRSTRSHRSTSADLEHEIREGHHVEISGREISEGLFGGSKKLFQRYLESVRPSVRNLVSACVTCMDQYTAALRAAEETTKPGLVVRTASTIQRTSSKIAEVLRSPSRRNFAGTPVADTSAEDVQMDDMESFDEVKADRCLRRALAVFEEMQWNVIERVSHQKNPLETSTASGLELPEMDDDEDARSDGDMGMKEELFWNGANVFREEYLLAFFFIFNFREAAKKVRKLVDAVNQLQLERKTKKRFWLPRVKLTAWLKGNTLLERHDTDAKGRRSLASLNHNNLSGRSFSLRAAAADIPLYTEGKETYIAADWFGNSRYKVWRLFKHFESHAVKFGAKMMIATIALAWPAYVWHDLWLKYRGTWALVALITVSTPTVGGSNMFAFYRILGTVFGAMFAWLTWVIAPGNPYVISLMTILWAYPWWYVFVATPHQRLGLTALMTYNVIVMLAYLRRHDSDSEYEISFLAKSRMITVSVGVTMALVVTSYMWPFVARIELRTSLSKTVYTLGILYSRLALLIQADEEWRMEPGGHPQHSHYDTMKYQKDRLYIRKLETRLAKAVQTHLDLLNLTRHEPRLKGPFPYHVYEEMLFTTQNLIDRMGNIRRIVDGEYNSTGRSLEKEEGFGDFVRQEIIRPLEKYRMDMFAAILLYFHVIAGSLNAKTPLPAFLPAARAARLRLFGKLKTLPGLRDASLHERKDQRTHYLYFMAYELATEDMIEELEGLADCVKRLFGQSSLAKDLVWDHADAGVLENLQPGANAVRSAIIEAMPPVVVNKDVGAAAALNRKSGGAAVPLASYTHG